MGLDWEPADVSMLGGFELSGSDILEMMARNQNFDLLIANMNEGVLVTLSRKEGMISRLKGAVKGYAEVKEESSKPLLTVVGEKSLGIDDYDAWSWKLICEARTELIDANIPFYPTMGRAARAARKLVDYYQKRS